MQNGEIPLKKLPLIAAVVAIAFGLLFIGQGLDYIRWPADSFMIDDINWAYYGLGAVVGGVLLILMARS